MSLKDQNGKWGIVRRPDFEAKVRLELDFLMQGIPGTGDDSGILDGLDNCEANDDSADSAAAWRNEIQRLYRHQQSILDELAEIDREHENDWKNEAKHLEILNKKLGLSYRYVLYLRANVWLLEQEHRDVIERTAREIVRKDLVLDHICRELRGVPHDPVAIASVVTPLLIDLVVSKTLPLPCIPALFAAVSLAIAEIGVFNLCGIPGPSGHS